MPETETQIRPLIGLTPEQAQSAWQRAIEKAGARNMTERLVKAAVKELGFTTQPVPISITARKTKAEQKRSFLDGFGELLMLLYQKAPYQTVTVKAEALHGQARSLLGKAKH